MKKLLITFCAFLLLSCNCVEEKQIEAQIEVVSPSEYVTTLVGTLSEHAFSAGNTYPAIAMPWGMNFWTPQTGKMGDGWAYKFSDRVLRGFKQTHQPSPWINDYGQFSVMPVRDVSLVNEDARASWFSHKSEEARPYYYSVYLADHDVKSEITPTDRAAMMRFTYPDSEKSGIIIDAFNDGSFIKVMPDMKSVVGYTTKNSGGVPDNFKNWFVIKFNKTIKSFKLYDGGEQRQGAELQGNHAIAAIEFGTDRGEEILMQVASSFIDEEQAFENLKELGNDSFDEIKKRGKERWDDILGRIEVTGGTVDQYRTFYSALYRSTLFPRKFYEINKEGEIVHYSPYNGKVCKGYMYTDTGFWDTFRSLFPLLNLVYPSVNSEIQAGLANTYRESGFLPEWASPGHRGCMVGNNSASVVSDAILKGITPKEDIDILYEAMLHGRANVHPEVSSTGRLGHNYYDSLGYVPYNVGIHENAARTLEYAYDDWCIAQVAQMLGHKEDAVMITEASKNYKNLFDSESNLMRGKNENGEFQSPFSSYKWGDAFTEGNSWHYTWSVFHDIKGLSNLMGGDDIFAKMLDSVFVVPPIYDDSYYGFRIHEITEMQVANMGNYAHGNQPAQHIIYLYNYVGEPWKAQWWSREVMDKLYSATPDGYCGDEDNGQTSAWYVFSSLGFYPVCPGTDEYILGSPLFKNATIHLENGKKIKISASNNSSENRYINDMKINNKEYLKNYLNYSELIKGANIDYDMDSKPNKARGISGGAYPYSLTE